MNWLKRWRGHKVRSTSLLAFEPSHPDLYNACMSYRHDFDLMPDAERKAIEFEAREWLRAWGHTLPQFKANAAGQGRRKPYPEPACSALDSEEHEGREERCDTCGEISHCLIRGLCPPCYELNGGTHE